MSNVSLDLAPLIRNTNLPLELLSQIFLDPCLSKFDLINLCRTSRQLLHPARQGLYHHLPLSLTYQRHQSIPPYRMKGAGRMCCDKRTLALLRTLRRSAMISSLPRSIEIRHSSGSLSDLPDFQCEHYEEGIIKVLKLVPRVVSLHDSGHSSYRLLQDTFLSATPAITSLSTVEQWKHGWIKEESSLTHLRKLRCSSFHIPSPPNPLISTAPSFLNLRTLDIAEWTRTTTEFPARLAPKLQVLRTSYASLEAIDISSFSQLQTLHLCNDWSDKDFPLENPNRISDSASLVTISFELASKLPRLHNSIEPILNRPPDSLRTFDFPNRPPNPGFLRTRLNDIKIRVREEEPGMTEGLDRYLLEMVAKDLNFRVVVFTETIDVFGKLL